MSENKVSVNYATCKKFLIANGLRASKDGVVAFQNALNSHASMLSKEATERALAKKRKTILGEDVATV